MSKFDEMTQSLWKPMIDPDGNLYFKNKYGGTKKATDEDSLIYEIDQSDNKSKYEVIINNASLNPVNPIQYVEEGCSKCGSKYLRYVRIDDNKNVIYTCSCELLK